MRLTLRALCLPVSVGRLPLGTSSTRATRLRARLIQSNGCGRANRNGPRCIILVGGPGVIVA